MKASYSLTPRAFEDLKNIGRYTQRIWGKEQRDLYLHAMQQRFEWLSAQPEKGRHRQDICEGYYSYPQGSHMVFYLIRENGIDIIGLPHQRMDISKYFLGDKQS